MQDEKIFRIAVLTTIIGLIGLILTSGLVNPEFLKIKNIDNSKMDNQVQIEGIVSSCIITKSGTQIIQISDDTGSINVVVFSSVILDSSNFKNKEVKVVGKVTQYKGQLELILEDSRNFQVV